VDIVGQGAKEILKIQPELPDNDDLDNFWKLSGTGSLQVIVTPYRDGRHDATKPSSFLPVIDQLDKLHKKGYVHGDIRGFNTVFDEDNGQGYLIDFDFGGKDGERVYPEGYRTTLNDGIRLGPDETPSSRNFIWPWHDWYALGRLIFVVHELVPPEGTHDTENRSQLFDLNRVWQDLIDDPTPEMITKLTDFLTKVEEAGWTVKPSRLYQKDLNKLAPGQPRNEATYPGATGSPPVKKGMVQ
jgi:serine/threonine protein kinase